MAKDHLAMLSLQPEDAEQHGIKGMKWGVRNSRASLKSAPAASASAPAKTHSHPAGTNHVAKKVGPTVHPQPTNHVAKKNEAPKPDHHVEPSTNRYSRIQQDIKARKTNSLSSEDLNFYNSRTEALKKIAKMNEVQPSWISSTSKKVLQKTAEQVLSDVAGATAKKYISGPIIARIEKSAVK